MRPYILLAAAGVLAADAAAQDANTSRPSNPAAPVPATTYQSAFQDYVPWRDPQLSPWRQVNDAVGAIGGHSGILGGAGNPANPGSSVGPQGATTQSPAGEGSAKTPASQAPTRAAPKATADGHGHGGTR